MITLMAERIRTHRVAPPARVVDKHIPGIEQRPTRRDQPEREVGIEQRREGVLLIEDTGRVERLSPEEETRTTQSQTPVPSAGIRAIEAG